MKICANFVLDNTIKSLIAMTSLKQISFKLIPNVSVQVRSLSLLHCIDCVVSDLGFLNLFCYDNTNSQNPENSNANI